MLSVKHCKKHYPGFDLECSIEVPAGRITGIIGQNGAGKSTLFKILLGLVFKDDGEITLFDRELSELTEADRRRIGSVLADSTFSGYLKISDAEQILKAFYPEFDESLFERKCRDLSLPMDKKISELSTGMKAKFKVICALTHGADFLILDEPTSGLDVIARDDVLSMLRDYMEENDERSILISSHISSDLETLCDDFYMIHEGKIILHEETDRLLSDYGLIKIDQKAYENLDKKYLLKKKKENYGYLCLSDHRDYYMENDPELVIEKPGIDDVINMMVKGVSV